MSVTVVKLPFRLIQFVLWTVAAESFSSHFVGVGRRTLLAPSQRQVFSTTHRKRQSLFSSRQPYDEADDGYDDFPSRNFREPSKEEIRLRRMAQNSQAAKYDDEDDDFYEEDRNRIEDRERTQRNGRLAKYDNSFDEAADYDDFYDEEDDIYEDEPTAGNFWSNPQGGNSRRGKQRQRRPRRHNDDDDDDDNFSSRIPRRRQQDRFARKRSPAPSEFGEPPKVFKQFYDQLFWYGFDINDSAKVGDNTVFGGTKGKFNGFNYLLPEQDDDVNQRSRPSRNSARRLPPSRNSSGGAIARDSGRRAGREIDSDYYLDGNDNEYEHDDDISEDNDYYRADDLKSKRKSLSSSAYTPPTDPPHTDQRSTRYDTIDDDDEYEYEDEDDDYEYNRRRSRKNSARYNDDDEYMDRRSGGRRRRRQQSSSSGPEWSPFGMIESFLGIDKEEMDYKADVYNAKMGLGQRRRSSGEVDRNSRQRLPTRRRSARDDPERRGYAYRYDAALDNESTPILDIDLADKDDSQSEISDSKRRQLSLDIDETKSKKKERSWEERQIAMERIPPIEIKGWGPSGELPMSAREKAFLDAQEDIETARRKLNLTKKKEAEVKEEITILKVDADRQQLKLSEYPLEQRSRRDLEELRQIELDIDDAARDLRSSRTKVDRALEKLEELEERHHAILSCYNIDQASLLVGETLKNFSASVQGTSATKSTLSSDESGTNVGDKVAIGGTDGSDSEGSEK